MGWIYVQVYAVHFKCNKKLLSEYPNLFNYTEDSFQIPGMGSIKFKWLLSLFTIIYTDWVLIYMFRTVDELGSDRLIITRKVRY